MSESLQAIAHAITYHPQERIKMLQNLPQSQRSAVFELLSPYVQQSILRHLHDHEIVELLDNLDLRHAEQALARLKNVKRRVRIVRKLKGEVREKAEYFLRFHPQATLSLINFDYLFVSGDKTLAQAADLIESHYEETGKYPELLVHEHGDLIGEVTFATLVRERNNAKLKNFVHPISTISYQTEPAKIVDHLVTTKNKKVVVQDHDNSIIGIIYADTMKSLFGELPAEALYDFAGVDDSERPFDSVGKKVSHRYRWLILNLLTAFGAGAVVLLFQDTLDTLTILSVYIPIMAGMGGNAATQSFAIMVRGLTLGTVSLQSAGPAIVREFIAGGFNGVIIGAIVAVISWLWNGEPLLGIVVGLALIIAHAIAAVAGAIVPLLMKNLGYDPAATSTIFITTITDVCGLLLLFGLATLILL